VGNGTALINSLRAKLQARPVRGFTLAEKTAGLNVVSLNLLPASLKENLVGKINAALRQAFDFVPQEILWDKRAKLPMLASAAFLPKLAEGLDKAIAALPVEIITVLDAETGKLYFLAEEENKRKIEGRPPEGLLILTPEEAKKTMPPIGAMVEIPGGEYTLGDNRSSYNNEKPEHIVTVDPFWADVFSRTNAQFRAAVDGGLYSTEKFWTELGWKLKAEKKLTQPGFLGDDNYQRFNGENQPGVGVSHYESFAYLIWQSVQEGIDVKDFLTGKFFDLSKMYDRQTSRWVWEGYRLLTEAEWEIAARGGLAGKQYPWGDEPPTGRAHFGLPGDTGSPVAVNDPNFTPNGYGLYHMAGNVYEWVFDNYDSNFYQVLAAKGTAKNPIGQESGGSRVVRGGSWGSTAGPLRAAYRDINDPDARYLNLGFRAARTKK
jgi:formylglycine-generating enzyme required for sulfatase activity